MILQNLSIFARFKDWTISARRKGVYSIRRDSAIEIVTLPQNRGTIIKDLGGARLTLSLACRGNN